MALKCFVKIWDSVQNQTQLRNQGIQTTEASQTLAFRAFGKLQSLGWGGAGKQEDKVYPYGGTWLAEQIKP